MPHSCLVGLSARGSLSGPFYTICRLKNDAKTLLNNK